MAATPVLPKLVGQRVKRREDPRLIQGRGTYVDDVKITGMQHLAFKRSDIAHGRIRVDRHARRGGGRRRRGRLHRRADRRVPRTRCRSGRPFPSPDHRAVAVRCGALRGRAGSGSRRVATATWRAMRRTPSSIEYDPLPVVVDPEQALTGQPAVLHADFPKNVCRRAAPEPAPGSSREGGRRRHGRSTQAFAEADVVVSQRMVEPPARADLDRAARRRRPLRAGASDAMTIWSSTQNPAHPAHLHRCSSLGLGQDQRAGDRAGGGGRIRLEDQHLRGGVRRRRAVSKRLGLPHQVGGGPLRGVPVPPSTGATSSAHVDLAAAPRRDRARPARCGSGRRHRRLQHATYGRPSRR